MNSGPQVLTVNGGSTSVKFALFAVEQPPRRILNGSVESGGLSTDDLLQSLEKRIDFGQVKAAGHRVVHGMEHTEPETVTDALLDDLRRISVYDPDHLPREIELIEKMRERHPGIAQVVCFDTAFHRTMPRVAKLLPIPRRFDARGVQRYGFHGLSYTYLMEELARVAGPARAGGRVILAHLGGGASLAAVRDGKCVDTSMGFTPAGGLPMSTRTGDLDPGVLAYLLRTENLTPAQFDSLIHNESGLLGVSETSGDMRELMQRRSTDERAAEAVELFCYQTRKWIGAFAAVLDGLDTLVFSGGIGENNAEVRHMVCEQLGYLGIQLDDARNAVHAPVISVTGSRATVRVIKTDEEAIIAREVCRIAFP